MEYIKRNSDYALRGLSYIAKFPRGRRFTIDEIAAEQDVPGDFLRKIFQKLSQHKIVGSRRGIGGGFYLLMSPSRINVNRILEVMQGPVSLNKCLTCLFFKKCKAREKLMNIQEKLTRLLKQTTLLDIA